MRLRTARGCPNSVLFRTCLESGAGYLGAAQREAQDEHLVNGCLTQMSKVKSVKVSRNFTTFLELFLVHALDRDQQIENVNQMCFLWQEIMRTNSKR